MSKQFALKDDDPLRAVLARLALGETVTLCDENGEPLAVVVSLQSHGQPQQATGDSAVNPARLDQLPTRSDAAPSAEYAEPERGRSLDAAVR